MACGLLFGEEGDGIGEDAGKTAGVVDFQRGGCECFGIDDQYSGSQCLTVPDSA